MSLPTTMRALRLHAVRSDAGREQLRVDELPRPDPAPDEVLIEVGACGICATDVHVLTGGLPHGPRLPQVLGHEPAGTVAAVGDEVSDWRPGDRVAVLMGRPCQRCGYCRIGRENLCRDLVVPGIDTAGALAGYLPVDPDLLVPVPPDVPLHEAAIVTDAVATPYHALKRAGVGEGSIVTVVGLGGLGMHAVLLAKLSGAHVIGIDVDVINLERAVAWGADAVIDATREDPVTTVHELTDGGSDRALEFVGSAETADQALRCVAPGGRAVLVGFGRDHLETLPLARFVTQELEVAGSYGATRQDVGELFDLLEDGRLDLGRSVTDTTDLDGAPAALRALETREGHPIRTVVTDLR